MNILTLVFGGLLAWQAIQWRRLLNGTTARSAATWAISASGLVCLVGILRLSDVASVRMDSALQYGTAILLLAPFIDLLGARRPSHRAWPWFVVLPMIVVLQWPSISQCLSDSGAQSAISIPSPTFLGVLFVVLMGCGNHFGTAQTLATLVAGGSIVWIALPASTWVNYTPHGLTVGSGLLLFSTVLARRPSTDFTVEQGSETDQPIHTLPPDQRLWADFRDIYGMVWAKRVMDRVNQFAERERWRTVMTLDGFRDRDSLEITNPDPVAVSRLCWVLRRFLSDDFMQRYIPVESLPNPKVGQQDEKHGETQV